jgi:hypothetical protein
MYLTCDRLGCRFTGFLYELIEQPSLNIKDHPFAIFGDFHLIF